MEAYDRKINIGLIEQLRNLEKVSLDHYIENVLLPLQKVNPSFYYTLYKDILYVLQDFTYDVDLAKENGGSVIEDNGFKASGYQTRLHDISIWLHLELIKQLDIESIDVVDIPNELNEFNKKIKSDSNYTVEYKNDLLEIKKSLKKEVLSNYDRKEYGIKKYLDFDAILDNVKIRPNIFGVELDVNGIFDWIRNK